MRLRTIAARVLPFLLLGAFAAGAYFTRHKWMPVVFPSKAAEAPDEHDEHDHHDDEHADQVKLSPQAQANLALDVGELTPREYWRSVYVPGVVAGRPGESDRGVTSKVAGVVTEISARPGDTVRAGDPLFTLQLASEFLQSAQTDLAKAARDLEFASARRDRVAALVKAGTQNEAVLIEEENGVKRLTMQVQAFRRQLLVFGLTAAQTERAEKGDVVTEVAVAVPPQKTAGWIPFPDGPESRYEVQSLSVRLGQQVQAGDPLCTLADHRRLYVEGRAFTSETRALAAAAERHLPVKVEFPGEAPGDWPELSPLAIHHLGTPGESAGNTFPFYLELENQSRSFVRDGKTYLVWRFRPTQRVRLRVPVEKLVTLSADGKAEVLPFVLPAGAVVREGAEAYVFVRVGDVFVRRAVRVLYEDQVDAVIARDGSVSMADEVVKNQAAALNRALKAAAAGEGGHHHDHEH